MLLFRLKIEGKTVTSVTDDLACGRSLSVERFSIGSIGKAIREAMGAMRCVMRQPSWALYRQRPTASTLMENTVSTAIN